MKRLVASRSSSGSGELYARLFWREAAWWIGSLEAVIGALLISARVFGGFGSYLTIFVGSFSAAVTLSMILTRHHFGKSLFLVHLLWTTLAVGYICYVGSGSGISVSALLLYIWIDLVAFAFLSRFEGLTFLATMAASFAIALSVGHGFRDPLAEWLVGVLSLGIVGLFTSRLVRRLARLAYIDELTGLPNRRYLLATLRRELMSATRTHAPLCVAMIDLDNFKTINDSQGHLAGDRLLAQLASAWTKDFRSTDFLARYGGDEFVVILRGATTEESSNVISRVLRRSAHLAGASYGIAQWDGKETLFDLIGRSDTNLLSEKTDVKRKSEGVRKEVSPIIDITGSTHKGEQKPTSRFR